MLLLISEYFPTEAPGVADPTEAPEVTDPTDAPRETDPTDAPAVTDPTETTEVTRSTEATIDLTTEKNTTLAPSTTTPRPTEPGERPPDLGSMYTSIELTVAWEEPFNESLSDETGGMYEAYEKEVRNKLDPEYYGTYGYYQLSVKGFFPVNISANLIKRSISQMGDFEEQTAARYDIKLVLQNVVDDYQAIITEIGDKQEVIKGLKIMGVDVNDDYIDEVVKGEIETVKEDLMRLSVNPCPAVECHSTERCVMRSGQSLCQHRCIPYNIYECNFMQKCLMNEKFEPYCRMEEAWIIGWSCGVGGLIIIVLAITLITVFCGGSRNGGSRHSSMNSLFRTPHEEVQIHRGDTDYDSTDPYIETDIDERKKSGASKKSSTYTNAYTNIRDSRLSPEEYARNENETNELDQGKYGEGTREGRKNNYYGNGGPSDYRKSQGNRNSYQDDNNPAPDKPDSPHEPLYAKLRKKKSTPDRGAYDNTGYKLDSEGESDHGYDGLLEDDVVRNFQPRLDHVDTTTTFKIGRPMVDFGRRSEHSNKGAYPDRDYYI